MKDTNPSFLRLQRKKERGSFIANYISTVKILPLTYSKFLAVDALSNPNINCIRLIATSIAKKKKRKTRSELKTRHEK